MLYLQACFSWFSAFCCSEGLHESGERKDSMFGEKRYLPSPYDYPSADDYYEAVDEYYKWLDVIWKKFSASLLAVPRALMTVPPHAPSLFAASITASL